MRKTETVVISADGRDKGKTFILTEMPALRAERWALRALMALAKSGAQMPEGMERGGMAAIAVAGLRALQNIEFDEAQVLLDEMIDCIEIMPDPRKNPGFKRELVRNMAEGDDIEEIATIFTLRQKVFELHTSFFTPVRP